MSRHQVLRHVLFWGGGIRGQVTIFTILSYFDFRILIIIENLKALEKANKSHISASKVEKS